MKKVSSIYIIIDYSWDADSLATTGEANGVEGEAQILEWTSPCGSISKDKATRIWQTEGSTEFLTYTVFDGVAPDRWEYDKGEYLPTIISHKEVRH